MTVVELLIASMVAFLRVDTGDLQDEPLNAKHAAELEEAIGHPLGDDSRIGGAS